jgi:hypothetical protein
MNALSHRDVINEAASLVRMEPDHMLRMEVTGLTRMLANPLNAGCDMVIARAFLDLVMKEIERREKAQAGSAQPDRQGSAHTQVSDARGETA